MAKSKKEIAEMIKNTRFRHRLIGGVDEADIWRKIEHLHREYEELIEVERQRAHGVSIEWKQYAHSLEKRICQLEAEKAAKKNSERKNTPSDGYG